MRTLYSIPGANCIGALETYRPITAFWLSSFIDRPSSCCAGFTVDVRFPGSDGAAGRGPDAAHPVTAKKNRERANAVMIDIKTSLDRYAGTL